MQSAFSAARLAFLDYLGCLAGGEKAAAGRLDGLRDAALRAGYCSHVLELDDGHRGGAVHIGGGVFSALISLAARENIAGDDFLRGAIAGYETTVRLACAIQPGTKKRGCHATGVCGTVGAAVACAVALRLDRAQTKSALSAAVTFASGVLEVQEDGSEMKPLNVGHAAMAGVAAAFIGRSGIIPPEDALGGRRGFLAVATDTPHPEFLVDFPDAPLAVESVYRKVYAACRHAHPAIEAALNLRAEGVDPRSVRKVKVSAYDLAVFGHDHTEITGVSSAKMSIPFGVALAFLRGGAGPEMFSAENIADPDILAFARKVEVVADPELSALSPGKRVSVVEMELEDGKVVKNRVDYAKGSPENPLSADETVAKFKSLMSYSGRASSVAEKVVVILNEPVFDVVKVLKLMEVRLD